MTQPTVTSSNLEQLRRSWPAHSSSLEIIAREPNGAELLRDVAALQRAIRNGSALPQVREGFIQDLIEHLARPAQTINQGNDITCSQTACMWYLARHDKAEFIRVCSSLVQEGQATLKGHQTLTIARNGLKVETHADTGQFDPRTQVEMLFQTSLMQSNSTNFDIVGRDGKKDTIKGTTVQQTVDQVSQITGAEHIGVAARGDLDAVFARISTLATDGKLEALNKEFAGVQGVFQWAKSGKDVVHDAAIDHFEIGTDGKLYIEVFHGWGKYSKDFDTPTIGRDERTGLEKISFEEYKNRCLTLILDKNQETSRHLGLQSTVHVLSSDIVLLVDPTISSGEETMMRMMQNKKQKEQLQEDERRDRAKNRNGGEEMHRKAVTQNSGKQKVESDEENRNDSSKPDVGKEPKSRKTLADILLGKE